MFECEFCKKKLSTKSSLTLHKKTTKYCLEIQGKENTKFECKSCNNTFSSKQNFDKHQEICKEKINIFMKDNKLLEKDLNKTKEDYKKLERDLNKIKEDYKILEKDLKSNIEKVEELKTLLKEKDDIIANIAARPTVTNNINVNINIDKAMIENNIVKYDDNYMIDGMRGVAEFIAKEVFPKEDGRYLCTDKARNTFKYKDEEGNVFKDPNCTKLIEITQPIIKNKLIDTYKDYEQQIRDYEPTEEDKKAILSGKAQLTFKKEKVLETKLEVVSMHMNKKFANHLADYLTV
jgi:hypothetical protein